MSGLIREDKNLEERNKDIEDKKKDLEDHNKEKNEDVNTVQLSAEGIRGVSDFDSKDFEFNIGGNRYLCGRLQACL